MGNRLLIKITVANDAPERSNQALNVAVSAVAAGAEVTVWLTGEAVWLATTQQNLDFGLAHATPVSDLIQLIHQEAQLVVCSQCAKRRELTNADFLAGVEIAGAGAFVEQLLAADTKTLVY